MATQIRFAGLLCCEMVARRGSSLGTQLEQVFAKVGSFYPLRENFRLTAEVKQKFTEKLRRDPSEFHGIKVAQVVRTDGLKLVLADGSWVCYRLSGTEPVVRAYSEARSREDSPSSVGQQKHGSSTRSTVAGPDHSTSGGRSALCYLSGDGPGESAGESSGKRPGSASRSRSGPLRGADASVMDVAGAGVASAGNGGRGCAYPWSIAACHVRSQWHGGLSAEARRDASAAA